MVPSVYHFIRYSDFLPCIQYKIISFLHNGREVIKVVIFHTSHSDTIEISNTTAPLRAGRNKDAAKDQTNIKEVHITEYVVSLMRLWYYDLVVSQNKYIC